MKKNLLFLLLNIFFIHSSFSQAFCNIVSDEPSTCFFGCLTVSGQLGGFSPDSQTINTTCLGSANTQWFKIIADSDIYSMTLTSTNCPFTRRIQAEVFDENFNSVSGCNEFRPTQLGRQLTATVSPGESYFVMIKEISGLNCNYEFELQGHKREIFGNTDTIQFEPGATLSAGELFLPPVAGATDYIWEPFDINISVDSAGNRLTYTYSGVDSAMICVTPVNDCGFGNRVCTFLPYLGCPAGSKTLPGCLVECPNLSILLSELSSDAFMGYTLDCQTNPLTRAYWFSLVADENDIIIEQAQAISTNVKIQIFDQNGSPVSDCKSFGINTNSTIIADSLIIGETYSVCVGTESNASSNAPIKLNIYGSSSNYEPLPKIKFEAGSTFDSGVAYIDSSYVIDSLAWGMFQNIEIVSGQGTNRVFYNNPDADAYIFLRGYTDDCGELHLQRTLLPGAVPGGNTSSPPCLPTTGGVPAGDNPPGCSLCGPIYQGSTSGYSPTAPGSGGFPCGTVENNQFISIVADGTGMFSGTVLASSCLNNQGVQLILYDQAFNPVSNCFSSGGTNLPGNVTASGLTPGETYWIMIDGFAGDICDILVTTSGGVNTSPPDPPGPMYVSPDTSPLCPGAVICYSIDPVMGATNYEWIIPGNAVLVSGGGTKETEICIEYLAPGGGVVRVTPSNPCFPGIPTIEPVVVLPILPTIKSPEFICPEDFPIIRDGNVFTDAGTFDVTYLTGLGCDSVVSYVIVPNVQIPYTIDTFICLGSCIQVGDVCYDEPTSQTIRLGPPYQQANGCDSIVILKIQIDSNTNISSDFTSDQNVCINQPINVNFTGTASSSATFDWNFNGATILSGSGSGPYQIAFPDGGAYEISLVVNESGCSSTRTSNTIVVNDRLAAPIISCQTTLSSIIFSWNDIQGATDYLVNVTTGQTGTLNGTEFEITGLSPNEEVEIEVSAISALGCASSVATQTCRAQDCPARNISIVPVNKICLNQNAVPIQMTVNPPNLTGTFAWSGAGISPTGLFDPNAASIGINQISVVYSENGCDYSAQLQIEILEAPTADFTLQSNICLNENLQITYTGNASTNAIFNWNFGNAIVISGSNSGPYELELSSSGTYDISLTVEENGCISDQISKTVLVESPLVAPVISCTSTNNSVEFIWDGVQGVDSFNVTVLSGQTGTLTGRSYVVQNLNPGDTVEINVTAVSMTSCPSVSAQSACITQSCPAVDLRISNPGNFCVGNDKINLTADPTGGVGGGTFVWSGDGVQGDLLDISGLTPGNYQIILEYTEGICSYIEIVDYKISAPPTVSSKILSPLWYPGTIGSIDLTVSGGTMPYTFNWSNGSTTEDLTDVTRGVLHCVTVTDSEGCEEQDCYEIGEGIFRINPINVACRNQPKKLTVRPSRGANFTWSPSTDLSCDDCASPTVTTSQSRFYNVTATLADGRTATQRVFVLVLPPGFCNIPLANNFVNQKLISSGLDFQNIQEKDFTIFEKEITESLLENSISIAPNPTSGIVKIESLVQLLNIEVFDLSGKKILTHNQKNNQEELSQIDLSGFSEGIYLLKINTNEITVVKRIMLMAN